MTAAKAGSARTISFTVFGVALCVVVPERLFPTTLAYVPPGAEPHDGAPAAVTISIEERGDRLVISADGAMVGEAGADEPALGLLDAQIRAHVALQAPEHIFVHAGVVAAGGRAIVMPGFTHSGKTTLTRALVEAGAAYYSDEFAVIDADGLVHPYARPLSIRRDDGSGRTTETPAAALGGTAGETPVPVGLIAVASYRPGASLAPEPLGQGSALLALLRHTIPARTRPQQSMAALRAAVRGASAWRSARGEAGEAARAILAEAL